MQVRVFTVSLNSDVSILEELNRFLRSVRVVDLRKELATVGGDSCWTFCVTYLDEATTASKYAERQKIDYMEVLDPETFARFSEMRKIRKTLAERDSVPAYAIFTDAELAEFVKLQEPTIQAMSSLKGIGKKRLEKYGKEFLSLLDGVEAETSVDAEEQTTVDVKPSPEPSSDKKKPAPSGVSYDASSGILRAGAASYRMVSVAGGTFTMGATSEQGSDADDDEKPSHMVTLSGFRIGATEVTQALWEAVMGSNPSYYKGGDLPVEDVSWDDCQEFIKKLNELSGAEFRLPTEAEWEYAARGGQSSCGYKYPGSDDIDSVAWYTDNSGDKTHPVGTKKANELGLYDMSGNVWEWCSDWYGDYSSSSQENPKGPSSGQCRVLRGGGWSYGARSCRVSDRFILSPGGRGGNYGLRLALSASPEPSSDKKKPAPSGVSYDASSGILRAGAASYRMVSVAGGTFTMGATSEQGSDTYDDELPTHKVTLSSFRIGATEVTQSLWEAVMGSNPSSFKGLNLPVEEVSWDDCQEFLRKLNSLTGMEYRLPTEAEWEYAARGGQSSRGYKYPGSDDIDSVAWYDDNSGDKTHPVGTKKANELGLYDMSGNVWEWCSDWYGDYSSSSQENPKGPSSGRRRVVRGGGWFDLAGDCRVSNRGNDSPDYRDDGDGLRLALSE